MVYIPDSRRFDTNHNPGLPAYRSVDATHARRAEEEDTLADPIGARDWDLRMQARWDAYAGTPECAAVAELFRFKSTTGWS